MTSEQIEPMHAPLGWFHLSFCDPDAPVGQQFLGVSYVDGPLFDDDRLQGEAILARSWMLGANPGGEVAVIGPLPPDVMDEHVPADCRRRVLRTRVDLALVGIDQEAFDAAGTTSPDER